MFDHLPIILIFAAFHPLWWILLAVSSLIMFFAIDDDKGGLASTTAIITLIALALFSDMPILRWIAQNPGNLLLLVLGYFVGGGLWGLVKWYLYVANRRDKYEDLKQDWLKRQKVTGSEIPEPLKGDWKSFLLDRHDWSEGDVEYKNDGTRVDKRRLKLIPIAWENKSRILTWMTYWPWSLLWAITNDFVRKAFKRIQRLLSDLMDRIAQFVFRDTAKDFKAEG